MKVLRYSFVKVITAIVAAVVLSYVIGFISSRVNFLERFSIAVTDIDFSDLYYQDRARPAPDTNIVIVNIGYLNRGELAGLIKTIADQQPKVIGLDILFSQQGDSIDYLGTLALAEAFRTIDNDVLASAYGGEDDEGRDVVHGQSPLLQEHVSQSIVNLNIGTDDPEMGTVRSFNPVTDINGAKALAFGFRIASMWNNNISPVDNEDDMFIRWYGYAHRASIGDSLSVFRSLDWQQIQNHEFAPEDIRGKIVVLGFLGNTTADGYSPVEQFYSPLNHKMIGRSLPDMYGVEIHANIIKMIIDDDFIYHSAALDFFVNYVMLVLLAMTLVWTYRKYGRQYAILSKVWLIVFIDILALGAIEVFIQSQGSVKILIGHGLFTMLFLPDTYEFLENNLFNRKRVIKAREEEVVGVG